MTVNDLASEVDRRLARFLEAAAAHVGDVAELWGLQFDLGLAWVWFPEGQGGLGLAPDDQIRIDEALREASVPQPVFRNPIGVGMAAHTLIRWGDDRQRALHLRATFTCEHVWCQLFSEPDAGSDLAAASTTAMGDGDGWVVTGQKVWTSLAHVAQYGLLLARTDLEATKHAGLSYFVLDMSSPGVEVRPLRQLTGDAEFNEVFLHNVQVPAADLLGEAGGGWQVAMTTLANERVLLGGSNRRGDGPIGSLLRTWRAVGGADPVRKAQVITLFAEAEVGRLTTLRAAESRRSGNPGPESSVGKLRSAGLNQRITALETELLGPAGQLADADQSSAAWRFLRARGNSIEGGTTEIQRSVLAERVLGLPREPRSADRS